MPDDAPGSQAPESAGAGGNGAHGTADGDAHGTADVNAGAPPGQPPGTARPRRRAMAGMSVAAAVAFTAVGFGAALVIRDQLSTAAASSAIPTHLRRTRRSSRTTTEPARTARPTSAVHRGPLVNLSGQVVGIDLTGSAQDTSTTSYAIPVNEALAVASQLKRS